MGRERGRERGVFQTALGEQKTAVADEAQGFPVYGVEAGAEVGQVGIGATGKEGEDGAVSRILLPLAPEYIGYADLGLSPRLLVSRRARIEESDDGFFKYRPDFEALAGIGQVAAI